MVLVIIFVLQLLSFKILFCQEVAKDKNQHSKIDMFGIQMEEDQKRGSEIDKRQILKRKQKRGREIIQKAKKEIQEKIGF
jgi:hypothetical protein